MTSVAVHNLALLRANDVWNILIKCYVVWIVLAGLVKLCTIIMNLLLFSCVIRLLVCMMSLRCWVVVMRRVLLIVRLRALPIPPN